MLRSYVSIVADAASAFRLASSLATAKRPIPTIASISPLRSASDIRQKLDIAPENRLVSVN